MLRHDDHHDVFFRIDPETGGRRGTPVQATIAAQRSGRGLGFQPRRISARSLAPFQPPEFPLVPSDPAHQANRLRAEDAHAVQDHLRKAPIIFRRSDQSVASTFALVVHGIAVH